MWMQTRLADSAVAGQAAVAVDSDSWIVCAASSSARCIELLQQLDVPKSISCRRAGRSVMESLKCCPHKWTGRLTLQIQT